MSEVHTFREHLEKLLVGRDAAIANVSKRAHFVPLEYSALRSTLVTKINGVYNMTPANFEKFYTELLKEVSAKYKVSGKVIHARNGRLYSPSSRRMLTDRTIIDATPAIVYSGSTIMGVMYATGDSFSSAARGLFTPILNKTLSKYLNKAAYKNTNYRQGFDIGHTIAESEDGILGTTPLWAQATNVIERVGIESLENSHNNQEEVNKILTKLNKLAESFTTHHEYGTNVVEALATIDKNFSSSLLSVSANIVIVQNRVENQSKFSRDEGLFRQAIINILQSMHFSRSFREEVIHRTRETLLGTKSKDTKAKKVIQVSKATKSIGSIVADKLQVTSTGGNLRNPSTNRKLGPSLASLQLIINQHLPHVISANMGDQPEPGGQRRILNYRTGRFANSAEVERLTMSKDGMVTAFYSYMKNPYATFSEGGRQYKSSRDPKKLISESIHEIARQYVGNRMRAVVV